MFTLGRELMNSKTKQIVWTNGVASTTTVTTFTFWGSVQPVGAQMLERNPEAARLSAKWVIYTESPTPPIDMTPPADRIGCSKGQLVPVGMEDYTNHITGLPHAAYICAEVSGDE